jgi:hypothetical protein
MVYVWNLKGYMHITTRGVSWKFANGAVRPCSEGAEVSSGVSIYRPNESFMEVKFTVTA